MVFRHLVVDNEVYVCTLHTQEPSLQFETIDSEEGHCFKAEAKVT